MIPEVLIIALAMTRLVGSLRSDRQKIAVIGLLTVVIMLVGTNIHKNGGFYTADNPYKVPQYAVNVFDKILSLDDSPSTILPEPLYIYARQYSGNIEMMYGRDVQGYIVYTTDERTGMSAQIESDNPDYPYSVIYITENNEMYWSYAYSIPPSSIEEQLAIVDQYGEDYRFSVGRIEFNKPLREMSMYSGTTLTSDKLVIRMVSDDIARIKDINLSSERNFTRLK